MIFLACDHGGPFSNNDGGASRVKSDNKNDQPVDKASTNDNSSNSTTASTEQSDLSNQSNTVDENKYFAGIKTSKRKAKRIAPTSVKNLPKSDNKTGNNPENKLVEREKTRLLAENNSNKLAFVSELSRNARSKTLKRSDLLKNEYSTALKTYENFEYNSPSEESISGFWSLENEEGKKYELFINNTTGSLKVIFTLEKETVTVVQDITVRKNEAGFMVTGSNLRLIGDYKNKLIYKADLLFFEFQSGDIYKVFEYQGNTRKPLNVKKHFRY